MNTMQLFYAQYVGQNVFKQHGFKMQHLIVGRILDKCEEWLSPGYLSLRSIRQITDDEAIQCAKICYPPFYDEKDRNVLIRLGRHVLEMPHLSANTYNYLRLIGVLVRFNYLDESGKMIEMSANEIIAKGWAKYQESEATNA
ncbi:MAG: hypothetical protein ACXVJE_19445 [Mucilaginibacter sp.]